MQWRLTLQADNALAHQIMFFLKKAIKQEQNSEGTNRVDLGPYELGTWATWNWLLRPPKPLAVAALDDRPQMNQQLTIDDRGAAAEVRALVIQEL